MAWQGSFRTPAKLKDCPSLEQSFYMQAATQPTNSKFVIGGVIMVFKIIGLVLVFVLFF
jgi:hypothetical protein